MQKIKTTPIKSKSTYEVSPVLSPHIIVKHSQNDKSSFIFEDDDDDEPTSEFQMVAQEVNSQSQSGDNQSQKNRSSVGGRKIKLQRPSNL